MPVSSPSLMRKALWRVSNLPGAQLLTDSFVCAGRWPVPNAVEQHVHMLVFSAPIFADTSASIIWAHSHSNMLSIGSTSDIHRSSNSADFVCLFLYCELYCTRPIILSIKYTLDVVYIFCYTVLSGEGVPNHSAPEAVRKEGASIMPIKYDKLVSLLKDRDYTTYKIRQENIMSQSAWQKIRTGTGDIDTRTIKRLCQILRCQPGDIMEYVEEEAE